MDKPYLGRVVEIVEKALVPLLLGFLVFTTQQAQVRIARAQTKLAEEQAKMSAEQGKQGFNIECIKLFFNDICGSDPKRQKMAMQLLKLVNYDLAKPLSDGVAQDSGFGKELRDDARVVRADIGAQKLSGYKIAIYCLKDSSVYVSDAVLIRDSLLGRVAAESVVVRPVAWSWFVEHNYSDGYQIRYEADTEMDRALDLKAILAAVCPGKEFRLETIIGRTPQFISILVAGAPGRVSKSTLGGTQQ